MANGLDDDGVLLLGDGTQDQRCAVLKTLLEEHGIALMGYIRRAVRRRVAEPQVKDLAEILYSDTWFKIVEAANNGNLLGVQVEERPRYIYGICRNVMCECFRQFKRAPSFVTLEDDIADARRTVTDAGISPDDPVLKKALAECIDRLNGQAAMTFHMRYTTGKDPLKCKDIATVLNIAPVTVAGYLKEARDSVRECMKRRGYGDQISKKGVAG